MSIQINLLAEVQVAEEQRRKDPVKRGIWIGSFVVLVVVLWIVELQLDIMYQNNQLNRLKSQWSSIEGKFKVATAGRARIDMVETRLMSLDRLSTNRFLWGNLLNALQQTVADKIQVVRVKGEQTYVMVDGGEPKTNSNQVVTSQPAASIGKFTLFLEGKDWDPAAQTYNKYKELLSNSDFFLRKLNRKDGFVLKTVSATTLDPSDSGRLFVFFSLESAFPEARCNE